MPFKHMPPDLTDFNNWFHKQDIEIIVGLDSIRIPEDMVKPIAKAAWAESARLHTEYYQGELARMESDHNQEKEDW